MCAVVFWLFRLNRGVWRFTTLNDVWRICQAVVLANLLLLPALFLLNRLTDFPRTAPLLASFATIGFLSFGRLMVSAVASGGLRAALVLEDLSKPPVLLVAEDQNAADFLRANQRSDNPLRIVGIVSPNPSLSGRSIDGCKVLGHLDQLNPVLEGFRVSETLLPQVATQLAPQFASPQVQAWQGTRCISHDRLPLVGPLDQAAQPSLWLCAAMGARGLSFSALCAELLAAWLGDEPLPLESNLAKGLGTGRLRRQSTMKRN